MAVHKPRPAWSFAYLLRGVAQIRAIVIKRYTESVWQALCCSAGKFPHAIWEILSGRLVSSALQKTGGALCDYTSHKALSKRNKFFVLLRLDQMVTLLHGLHWSLETWRL